MYMHSRVAYCYFKVSFFVYTLLNNLNGEGVCLATCGIKADIITLSKAAKLTLGNHRNGKIAKLCTRK